MGEYVCPAYVRIIDQIQSANIVNICAIEFALDGH